MDGRDRDRRTGEAHRRRQLEWLSERHAGGEIPDGAASRAARVSRQSRRRDDSHADAIGHGGQRHVDRPSIRPISPTTSFSFATSKRRGWVRRAISVVKKRNGFHERTIREIDDRRARHRHRRTARRIPGRSHGRADLCRQSREAAWKRPRCRNRATRSGLDELCVLACRPPRRTASRSRSCSRASGFAAASPGRCRALRSTARRAGVVVIAEEALVADSALLVERIRAQEVWSDLPIIVLSRAGLETAALADDRSAAGQRQRRRTAGPHVDARDVDSLRACAHAARQYQVREHLAQQEEAQRAIREAEQRFRCSSRTSRTTRFS